MMVIVWIGSGILAVILTAFAQLRIAEDDIRVRDLPMYIAFFVLGIVSLALVVCIYAVYYCSLLAKKFKIHGNVVLIKCRTKEV